MTDSTISWRCLGSRNSSPKFSRWIETLRSESLAPRVNLKMWIGLPFFENKLWSTPFPSFPSKHTLHHFAVHLGAFGALTICDMTDATWCQRRQRCQVQTKALSTWEATRPAMARRRGRNTTWYVDFFCVKLQTFQPSFYIFLHLTDTEDT